MSKANRTTVIKAIVVTIGMFGFGFALVPLYSLVCQAFGLNGQTERITEVTLQQMTVDQSRQITVRMDANTNTRLPWQFEPNQRQVTVHPGEMTRISYRARN
ncbi:MAG TPA: cytochrome c oxidase assembly protein, partial [Gammaproteobacteria bacterium]|nr:cytochrome c oxidase assembly protein [Gammaproteobacteria bacterium]